MLVNGTRRGGGDLTLLFGLLLDFGDLLTLRGGGGDLHAEDDVAHFALRQRGDVHVILLTVIGQNHILQRQLDLQNDSYTILISDPQSPFIQLRDIRSNKNARLNDSLYKL